MATKMVRVLCVGDSRLGHLQALLNNNRRDISFSCFVYPGATLGRLAYETRIIMSHVAQDHYDYIVILGGICDLTLLQKCPVRWIKLAHTSVAGLVDNFERLISLCKSTINLFTACPIIFATVPGVHLNRYIGTDSTELFHSQPVLDAAIPLINVIIKEMGRRNGVPILDLAKFIHHSKGKRGTYRTRYCRLHDGCHPNADTRILWSQEILKTLTNYIYATF